MNRKITYISILLLVVLTINAQEKPNVLLIIADDLRTELNCYGVSHIKSPNIDKLASNGAMFTNAYVQQAVCSASRASFLTGCRPDVVGVDYPYSEYFMNEFWPSHPSIAEYFEQLGYNAQTYGKIHHGPADNLKSEHFDAEYLKYYALPENKKLGMEKGRNKNTPPYECADVEDEAYKDGMVTKVAVDKIKKLSKEDEPFFLAVGYKKPHLPFCAPKKYWDMYNVEDIPLAENPDIPKGSPAYSIVHYELGSYNGLSDRGGATVPIERQRTLNHGYAACVSYIDAQVGKLINQLEESGELDNTIIMFMSDHGFHLGDHGMWGKHTNFEKSTLAPMIISVPGKTNGIKLNQIVEYVDVYPTLVELAGFTPADYLEGTSIAPLLDKPNRAWKKAAFSQFPRGESKEGYAIRTKKFRYVEWRSKPDGSILAVELYDERIDPLESNNLANDSKYKAIRELLSTQLEEGWKGALPEGIENLSDNPLAPPSIGWKGEVK